MLATLAILLFTSIATADEGAGLYAPGNATVNATGSSELTPYQYTNATAAPAPWTFNIGLGFLNNTSSVRTDIVERSWITSPPGTISNGTDNGVRVTRDMCYILLQSTTITPQFEASNGSNTEAVCNSLIGSNCSQTIATYARRGYNSGSCGSSFNEIQQAIADACSGVFNPRPSLFASKFVTVDNSSSETSRGWNPLHAAFNTSFWQSSVTPVDNETYANTVYDEKTAGGQAVVILYEGVANINGQNTVEAQVLCARYSNVTEGSRALGQSNSSDSGDGGDGGDDGSGAASVRVSGIALAVVVMLATFAML